jgi:hypothetical protein
MDVKSHFVWKRKYVSIMNCENITAESIYIVRGFVVFIITVVIVPVPFLA